MTISYEPALNHTKVYYNIQTRKDWEEAYRAIRSYHFSGVGNTLSYIIHNNLIYHCLFNGQGIYTRANNAPFNEKYHRLIIAQCETRLYKRRHEGL